MNHTVMARGTSEIDNPPLSLFGMRPSLGNPKEEEQQQQRARETRMDIVDAQRPYDDDKRHRQVAIASFLVELDKRVRERLDYIISQHLLATEVRISPRRGIWPRRRIATETCRRQFWRRDTSDG